MKSGKSGYLSRDQVDMPRRTGELIAAQEEGRDGHMGVALRAEPGEFVHEALLYAGLDGFLEGTLPFLREGLEGDEPMLVAVDGGKIARLRDELGPDRERVCFADMAEVGANPARIIPVWQRFLDEQGAGDRPLRGIGEPIWNGRSPAELVECQRHESLLNLAFTGGPPWRLLCPYDTDALEDAVIDEALRSHPGILEGGARRQSESCRDLGEIARPFDSPLPEPLSKPDELAFAAGSLAPVRHLVQHRADDAGLSRGRTAELVMAVNEVATNSVRHGGGQGVLRVWQEDETLVCEIRDRGRIGEPMVGRRQPRPGRQGGRGLWIANQLCELVQVRSFEDGSVVRLFMRRG
jgi:anti-sigma regulatory factor (Ser/Thr protein kinase)